MPSVTELRRIQLSALAVWTLLVTAALSWYRCWPCCWPNPVTPKGPLVCLQHSRSQGWCHVTAAVRLCIMSQIQAAQVAPQATNQKPIPAALTLLALTVWTLPYPLHTIYVTSPCSTLVQSIPLIVTKVYQLPALSPSAITVLPWLRAVLLCVSHQPPLNADPAQPAACHRRSCSRQQHTQQPSAAFFGYHGIIWRGHCRNNQHPPALRRTLEVLQANNCCNQGAQCQCKQACVWLLKTSPF